MRPRRSKRGFTLVETLIALAILAFAIMGLLMALNTALKAARDLRREAGVRQELENRLAILRLETRQEFRRESPPDARGVTYLEEILPERVVNAERSILNGYRRIRVTAKWREGQPEEREASFLVLSP